MAGIPDRFNPPAIIETIPIKRSWEEYVSVGIEAREQKDNSQWELGDLACGIEKDYGNDTIGKFANEIGVNKSTLKNYVQISKSFRKVPRGTFSILSYSHFREIAPLEDKEYWLEQASDNDWSVEQLRIEIKNHKKQQDIEDRIEMSLVEDGDSKIIHGNCLEEISRLKNESISCLITDPPYGISYISNYRLNENEITREIEGDNEDASGLLKEALNKLYSKLKINASLYVFTSWKNYSDFIPAFEKYRIKNLLIWVKNNWSMGDLYGNYAEQYEMIIYATKGKPPIIGSRDTNILNFDRVPNINLIHSAEKPVDLLEYLIEKSTVEKEIICDPFAGSGSTYIASQNKNRNCISIEKDSKHYKTIIDRISGYN